MQHQEVVLQGPLINVSALTLGQLDRHTDESPLMMEIHAILDPSHPQEAAAGFESTFLPTRVTDG